MSNQFFQFKQFTVYQDRCAMKVGTDGVLLGAWAQVAGAESALDIGTGTGLLALMIAQRNSVVRIVGVEIADDAAVQAAENVARSPWADRIKIVEGAIQDGVVSGPYDVIVSNPPYFKVGESVCSPDRGRLRARQTSTLGYDVLIDEVVRLLGREGEFSVVYPSDRMDELVDYARGRGLFLSRRTWVCPRVGGSPKRVLLAFRRVSGILSEDELAIELSRHVYTREYVALTRAFYLGM